MSYDITFRFKPVYEFMNSLHTFICRKSHKKIELSPKWVKETQAMLTTEYSSILHEWQMDEEWKYAYLLLEQQDIYTAEDYITFLENTSDKDLLGHFVTLCKDWNYKIPDFEMKRFKERYRELFYEWNEQYFKQMSSEVCKALQAENAVRLAEKEYKSVESLVDETTRGLVFNKTEGFVRIVLIPQYHFQPLHIFWHYGNTIVCHYAAPVYLGDDTVIPPHDLRVLRSLGEKNRLKILKYLHQGPRSFIEIVRHLQLSKGITHDHISKLRSSGLLYAHFDGENLIEYSIRSHALRQVEHSLLNYIEG
ncbi:winged helix-turn-helix domain-containing protein [Paenibacillus polygoni]|uniref:Winged helix-turn-helix domain-containing protein n=1 Tax=Paenibacillus polygoni TaxID=3050112 RepID=A0ABY8WZZ9_9BACL|nr:winged helix-turn-helix domain-containing protein [Paenibacillus polygoni]WIV17757.1 winged helix-turn-helix domain-containing protein [Paenibacillus polygoni]